MKGTALVTGAARRLGRDIALHLAERGMDVVIHCHRSVAEAAELQERIELLGQRAVVVPEDLSSDGGAQRLMDRAIRAFSGLDAVVNSASIYPTDTILDVTLDDVMHNMQVNAVSPLVIAREFAARCGGGAVVNLLDSRVVSFDREHAAYHLSKRVLDSVTRMLALELAPSVRVNAVAPGFVLPPEHAAADYFEKGIADVPLGRQGSPSHVSRAVAFLIDHDFITGQTIFVDGGRHLTSAFYG
jgi:NAD(P)-dependent dehydrogenase (short-subunit alcohol dehydrogenase family)